MSIKLNMDILQKLREYRNAVAEDDFDKAQQHSSEILNLILYVQESDRREELQEIKDALDESDADNVFKDFALAAKKFGEVKDVFALGEVIAAGGKSSLFFPIVASKLATFSGSIEALKQAADQVMNNIGGIDESFKKKDVEALLDGGKQIIESLESFKVRLIEMKAELPD